VKRPDRKQAAGFCALLLALCGAGCSGINANVPVSPAMFMMQNTHPPSPFRAMETLEATPLLARAE
jgi:hypothetical protein